MSSEMIIGGLNEKDLMNLDYVETHESGLVGFNRIYDTTQYGWMQREMIKVVVIVYKRDLMTAKSLMPRNPTSLTTVGGKNNDGTTADRIVWGSGYTLHQIQTTGISPTFVQLSATYRKDIAEAGIELPEELDVSCSAGVYTIKWQDITYKTFDNDLGSCGSAGLTFSKVNQEKRRVTAYIADDADPHVSMTVQNRDRWYNVLQILVDGVLVETQAVLIKEISTDTATTEAYDAGSIGEVVHETTYLGTDYSATLYWEVSGNTVRLYWSDSPIWEFSN